MSDPASTAWLIAYATAWYHAGSRLIAGVVHDYERAAIAAAEADRIVAALRVERPSVLGDGQCCARFEFGDGTHEPDCRDVDDGGREP